MITVSILYPRTEGGRFDADYYLAKHMPMALARLGAAVRAVSVETGLYGAQAGTPPAFVAICRYTCDSEQAFYDAFRPHASEMIADRANFTDIQPLFQISEVRLARPS